MDFLWDSVIFYLKFLVIRHNATCGKYSLMWIK